MTRASHRREIPPTAGLPAQWRDLLCPATGSLAQGLARWLDIPSPVLTCSGTAALVVALRTLQARYPGRTNIIVPAYTCPLVALAAFHCPPLKVVACDLRPQSIDMDDAALRRLCDEQTLAVVVTHLAGRVADVAAAKRIAAAAGALVIEDAAQAMGARQAGQSVGLEGDLGFFSLALGKGLTTAEGGVLFSRDPQLHQALGAQARRDLPFSLAWEARRCAELWGYAGFYHPRRLFYVYGRPLRRALAQGDEIGAVGDDFSVRDIPLHSLGGYRQRAGAAALARLPASQQQARERALRRVAQLNGQEGIQVLTDGEGQQGVWPFLMVIMPTQAARDAAMAQLWTAGLGVTRLFIRPLSGYPDVVPLLAGAGDAPEAAAFAARTLSVTNSHWLDDEAFATVSAALRQAASFPPAGVNPLQQA